MPVPAKHRAKSKTRSGRAHKGYDASNLSALVAHRYKKGAAILKDQEMAKIKKQAKKKSAHKKGE